ncbi:MAG: STAS-like domain-containing protein, partial [Dehalococcoidia bacterium]
SRSQAKRVLARFDRFKEIMLDFDQVEFIGQAFADEIFRVFKNAHPDIKIFPIGANEDVEKMIERVTIGVDEAQLHFDLRSTNSRDE